MKTWTLTLLASSVLALTACQQPTAGGAASGAAASGAVPAGLESNNQQVSYIIGQQMGEQLAEVKKNGGEIDVKILAESLKDKLDGKPSKLTDAQMETAMKTFMDNLSANAKKKAEEAQAAGDKFLAENKTKEGVKTTDSGLQYKVVKEGTGSSIALGDGVMVEYTGKLIDGTEFDSTKAHGGEPLAVALTENSTFIRGWIEGLPLMKEGGEYTLYVPAKLAYGAMSPTPKIPANSVLVFDMKIVKVEKGAVKEQAKSDKKPAAKK